MTDEDGSQFRHKFGDKSQEAFSACAARQVFQHLIASKPFMPISLQFEGKMQIEVGKYYRTRDGGKALIMGMDDHAKYPIVGRINGHQEPAAWNRDGDFIDSTVTESGEDLIAPWCDPIKVEGWVNMYAEGHPSMDCAPSPGLFIYKTKADADKYSAADRLACVRVTGEET
jgi:hypothetical protein